MTDSEKLAKVKSILGISNTSQDTLLNNLLDLAKEEILNSMYPFGNRPVAVYDVPLKYEIVQIQATIIGYNEMGAEGETKHNENGINRTFKYSNMLDYIHNNVMVVASL